MTTTKLGGEPPIATSPETLSSAFAALGETKRLGILRTLAAGERCACDLTSCCGDRQPLLSFHLKKLREAGLVRARKEGRWMHYALDREALRALAGEIERLADGAVDEVDACCG
ncbi:MAG: metalloregulator ArsR/SmtB family transcription factor [Gemmatimonadetes bacterium]|nr:metalloregulator ArsR/SmtB family transcription factor [Gemmatimonadota bacterium]